jgi:transposase
VVQDYIRALESRGAALEAVVQRLGATVHDLTERLPQDARTSSRPPSSDPPQAIGRRPRHEPSGRRPGGQPGHEGPTRALVPIERVDVVIPVKPECCSRCQHPWHGEDGQPQRHHVREIPPVKPLVTAYQRQQLVCPVGGETTGAKGPVGVPSGAFGPRVQAVTAWCTGAYHRSKRTRQRVMEDLLGVSIRLGTLAHLEPSTAQAVAVPVADARSSVQPPPAAYRDDTGGREGRQRAWLWTAVTAAVPVLVVRLSRRGMVARELLGERFWGDVVTARWSAYTW